MDAISVSQLKTNPSGAIGLAADYPLSIKNKGQTTAYLIGNQLFNKIIAYLENVSDKKTVQETNFGKGRNLVVVGYLVGIIKSPSHHERKRNLKNYQKSTNSR